MNLKFYFIIRYKLQNGFKTTSLYKTLKTLSHNHKVYYHLLLLKLDNREPYTHAATAAATTTATQTATTATKTATTAKCPIPIFQLSDLQLLQQQPVCWQDWSYC